MHIHRACRYCVSSFFQAYDRGYGGEGIQAADKKSEAGSFGSGVLSYSSKSGKRREEGHSQRTVNEGNVEGSTGKIAHVHEFGMGDKEVFLLGGSKRHEIGKITRSIQETAVMIQRIFGARISCGISNSGENLKDMPALYAQAAEALDYNLVLPEESYTYYNDIMPQQEEEDWNSQVEMIGKSITYCTEEELKNRSVI